jgi:putative ABC transport system permease protein
VLAFAFLGGLSPQVLALIVVYAILMLGICLVACVGPTLRALAVQPTEVLRAER